VSTRNSTILVTGAGTGIGSRTVRALAEVQIGCRI